MSKAVDLGRRYGAPKLPIRDIIDHMVRAMVCGSPRVYIIIGVPGVGKTAATMQAAEIAYQRHYKDRGYTLVEPWSRNQEMKPIGHKEIGTMIFPVPYTDPSYLKGFTIPNPEEGTLKTCLYNCLPKKEKGVEQAVFLVFDELLRGQTMENREVQALTEQLMEQGTAPNITLPDNTVIIGTTNPDDGSDEDISKLRGAKRRRAVIFIAVPDMFSWIQYGSQHRPGALFQQVHPNLLTFVEAEGMEALYNYDAEEAGQITSNPASLSKVDTLYKLHLLTQQVRAGGKAPTLEQLSATFPEHHVNVQQTYYWLQAAQKDMTLLAGWELEQLQPLITGFIGENLAVKFQEVLESTSKIITAQDILFHWENVEPVIKEIKEIRQDRLSKWGLSLPEALWNVGIGNKKFNTALTGFSNFLSYAPADTAMRMFLGIFEHFKELDPSGQFQHPTINLWLSAFRKHPKTMALCVQMIGERTSLEKQVIEQAAKERRSSHSRSQKAPEEPPF